MTWYFWGYFAEPIDEFDSVKVERLIAGGREIGKCLASQRTSRAIIQSHNKVYNEYSSIGQTPPIFKLYTSPDLHISQATH